eukprot:TRINITY_DN28243_c0_g2_i1.p1 TRINITY_DN28243_c0_g2~~TRINITY_DN28243_c0_g2_i1.p1  ORF type:complete len:330 (+),score=64.31 TRINITY_DN28243_c0_g2_i1:72-1061(+)
MDRSSVADVLQRAGKKPRLEMFPNFAPLLEASEEYASHSGSRFRRSSFLSLETACEQDASASARLAAKLKCVPQVNTFAARLRAGDSPLLGDLDKAFALVMQEGVKNAMVGTCKSLELFPPAELPEAVDEEDCNYQDVTAHLEVIAQRLHNAERARSRSGGKSHRQALEAAFIVEFASEAGVRLPSMPSESARLLREFTCRAAEWAARHGDSAEARVRNAFLAGVGGVDGAGRETLAAQLQQEWRKVAIAGAAGAVAVGVVASPVSASLLFTATTAAATVSAIALSPLALGAMALGAVATAASAWSEDQGQAGETAEEDAAAALADATE